MQNNKILILNLNMLPHASNWGSIHRMYILAEWLSNQQNKEVTVASIKSEDENYFGYNVNFNTLFFPLQCSSFMSKIMFSNRLNIIEKVLKLLLLHIFKYVNILFDLEPSYRIGIFGYFWSKENYKNIKEYVTKNKIYKIIISAPPFTLHRRFINLKSLGVEIIIDYRDPFGVINRNVINRTLQKKVLNKADLVLVFSEKYKKYIVNRFNFSEEKIISLYNGYSEKLWNNVDNKKAITNNKLLNIGYLGGAQIDEKSYVNILPLLETISKEKYNNEIIVKFVGNINGASKNYWINKLRNRVEFVNTVAHKESLYMMGNFDLLIVLYTYDNKQAEFMLTTKLFDYIKSGTKIWGIGIERAGFVEIINKYNLGYTCNFSKKDIESTLDKILTEYKMMKFAKNKFSNTKHFSRENQFEKLKSSIILS